MKTTKELFQESIVQYQALTRKATFLSEHMASMSPDQILETCEQLNVLQSRQIEVDKFILEIMRDTGPEILNKPYTGEYQRQLDKAMQACDKVSGKAQTIRGLLQTEMSKLKKSQLCLAEYNSFQHNSLKNTQRKY